MNYENLSKILGNLEKRSKAELYKRNYWEFVQGFWPVLVPDTELVPNWHLQYLANELQYVASGVMLGQNKEYDLIINIPPSTLKSTLCTIMLPIWCWLSKPALKFITASYSYDLSIEHSVYSRDIIRSDLFQELYPDMQIKDDKDMKRSYQNIYGGTRNVTSVGGTATGKHGDIIIVDDPLNPRKAASDTERETANAWLDKTLSTRKNDRRTAVTILVMQRLHEDDCTGHWLSKLGKKIKHICLPAEVGDNVKPDNVKQFYVDGLFDPIRLNTEVLEAQKIDLGSADYAGQMLQSPYPPEGYIVKKRWFKYFYPEDIPDDLARHFYSDTAYGKEGGDNNATICYSIHLGNIYIWNVWVANCGLPEFKKGYIDFVLSNNCTQSSKCIFEPKSTGISVVQELKRMQLPNCSYLNVIEDASPADSKETRVKSISPIIESGRLFLRANAPWLDSYLAEFISFPNGKHDDQVDATTGAVIRDISSEDELKVSII